MIFTFMHVFGLCIVISWIKEYT